MKFRDPIEWEDSLPIRPSSPAWRCVVKAVYGTPLEPDELALFRELSGGREPPDVGSDELLAIVGRRGGKSETIARVAVYEGIYGGHAVALAPGQTALFAIISPLREQSAEVLRYAVGLSQLPTVKRFVVRQTADTIEFSTGVSVQVMTASDVSVVGRTLVGVIADEFARWPGDDSATPDRVILDSLRPGLAPVVGAPRRRFFGISSAYIREGSAYELDRHNYGKADAHVLVVRGPTRTFNPNIDEAWLERERKRVGERAFAREYEAVWVDAVTDGFFAQEIVDRCVDRSRPSSAPRPGRNYVVCIDPAWRGDWFALAVAHRERVEGGPTLTVIDFLHAWKAPKGQTLSTESVFRQIRQIATDYGTSRLFTDQAAAPVLIETARRHALHLVEVPWRGGTAEGSKASKFRQVLMQMRDGLVRLPNDEPTIREFLNIGSRLLKSGAEQIEAFRGHDDRVTAVVLATTEAMHLYPTGGGLPVNATNPQAPIRPRRNLATGVGDGSPFGSGGTADDRAWDRARRHHASTHESAPPAPLGVLAQPGIFPRG